MGSGSLLERLQAREQAARARVAALRVEMDRLAGQVAAEEELLGRLEITTQMVIEVLSDPELHGQHADAAEQLPVSAWVPGLKVPVFDQGQGGDGDGRGLPVAYRDVVEVVADAGRPLRASQVCQVLGVGGEPRHREGMRSKLKRLVQRGWLVEVEPGRFACVGGVTAALDAEATRRHQ
jgi:hypothetical protein